MLQAIHISIAWSLDPPAPLIINPPQSSSPPPAAAAQKTAADVKANEPRQAGADDEVIEVKVEAVKVKMGNVIHSISLRRDWRKEGGAGSGILGDR